MLIGLAEVAFARHRYQAAWAFAGRAYKEAVEGAEEAGVDVERSVSRALRKAAMPRAEEPGETTIDVLDPDGPRHLP